MHNFEAQADLRLLLLKEFVPLCSLTLAMPFHRQPCISRCTFVIIWQMGSAQTQPKIRPVREQWISAGSMGWQHSLCSHLTEHKIFIVKMQLEVGECRWERMESLQSESGDCILRHTAKAKLP